MKLPDYLRTLEDCIAEGCTVETFQDTPRMTLGFLATKPLGGGQEELRNFEIRLADLREYYRPQLPMPEGAVVANGWIQQTLSIEEFLSQRRTEGQRVVDLFSKDIAKAAARGHQRRTSS